MPGQDATADEEIEVAVAVVVGRGEGARAGRARGQRLGYGQPTGGGAEDGGRGGRPVGAVVRRGPDGDRTAGLAGEEDEARLVARSRRRSDRAKTLREAAGSQQTIVLFESPHRLRATLADIADALNDPPVAVCRELTKLHEEVWRGAASDALDYFTEPRGEFTIVIGPVTLDTADQPANENERLETARRSLIERRAAGKRGRDAVAEVVAATGLPRRAVYALWVETGRSA